MTTETIHPDPLQTVEKPRLRPALAWLLGGLLALAFVFVGRAGDPSTDEVLTAPGFCEEDAACGAGNLCVRSMCVSPQCRDDAGCGRGERCVAYSCVDAQCEGSSDCGSGIACVDGQCLAPAIERIGVDRREMALVRGGVFPMGTSEDIAVSDERPAHWVEIDSFWLDRLEVSAADYAICIEGGGCAEAEVGRHASDALCTYGGDTPEQFPVNCVSWKGASDYCAWAGKRLPTEAEWERAAGGGIQRYPWGNRRPTCDITCRKERDTPGCGSGHVCDLAPRRDVSPFGVVGMGGNVGEWMADWYDSRYYRNSPRLRPAGPESGERRSVRGGDYLDLVDPFRLVGRDRLKPGLKSSTIGVRCARNL